MGSEGEVGGKGGRIPHGPRPEEDGREQKAAPLKLEQCGVHPALRQAPVGLRWLPLAASPLRRWALYGNFGYVQFSNNALHILVAGPRKPVSGPLNVKWPCVDPRTFGEITSGYG